MEREKATDASIPASQPVMDVTMKIDETSCGPFCQHPYCWYSQRRMERGLPQTIAALDSNSSLDTAEELPTLKVLNLLEEYGSDPRDHYPSQQPLPRRMHSKEDGDDQERSHSAPTIRQLIDQPAQLSEIDPAQRAFPRTPHQTPVTSQQGPQKRTTKRERGGAGATPYDLHVRSSNRSAPARAAPFEFPKGGSGLRAAVKKVDMRDVLDLGTVKHQGILPGKKIYIWCPGKNEESAAVQDSKSPELSQIKTIHPKDVTAELLPEPKVAGQGKSKQITGDTGKGSNKKSKKRPQNHQTPTGGRPYTHPARSPPPLTRRTLPQDFDEGIAQLLQLPRDVLLELLEHTKESDLFDKGKVAMLLEQLMPLIRFDKDDLTQRAPGPVLSPLSIHPHHAPPMPPPGAPLRSSGILQQKKVTLVEGRQKKVDPLRAPPPTRSLPYFLDESALSGITSSSYTRRERPDPHGNDDRETTMPSPTIASEDLGKRKSQGRVRAAPTEMSHYSRRKVTSVSAKSLPPIQPGIQPIRPFNYTAHSLDLALSPLSTLDDQASEKASSPYSGRASTVYVTVPSQLSGHTPPQTPCTCERTPIPPIPRLGSANYSTTSSVPSEEFPELHWVDYESTLHKGIPHGAPPVFRVPYGTPSVGRGDDVTQSAGTTQFLEKLGEINLPLESPAAASSQESGTPATNTDACVNDGADSTLPQERMVHTADTTDTTTADMVGLPTPRKLPESTTPYDASTSVMAQGSEKAIGSPMNFGTPLPSTASPEVWPVVDERDFMKSPDKIERMSSKKLDMILAPVAPPPSPEPAGMDADYDLPEVANKSTVGSSLTPLAEEEEEEGDGVRDAVQRPSEAEDIAQRIPTEANAQPQDNIVVGDHPTRDTEVVQERTVETDPAENTELDLERTAGLDREGTAVTEGTRAETGATDAERTGTRELGYMGDDEDGGDNSAVSRLDTAHTSPEQKAGQEFEAQPDQKPVQDGNLREKPSTECVPATDATITSGNVAAAAEEVVSNFQASASNDVEVQENSASGNGVEEQETSQDVKKAENEASIS